MRLVVAFSLLLFSFCSRSSNHSSPAQSLADNDEWSEKIKAMAEAGEWEKVNEFQQSGLIDWAINQEGHSELYFVTMKGFAAWASSVRSLTGAGSENLWNALLRKDLHSTEAIKARNAFESAKNEWLKWKVQKNPSLILNLNAKANMQALFSLRAKVATLHASQKYEVIYDLLRNDILQNKYFDLQVYFASTLLNLGFDEEALNAFEQIKRLEDKTLASSPVQQAIRILKAHFNLE